MSPDKADKGRTNPDSSGSLPRLRAGRTRTHPLGVSVVRSAWSEGSFDLACFIAAGPSQGRRPAGSIDPELSIFPRNSKKGFRTYGPRY